MRTNFARTLYNLRQRFGAPVDYYHISNITDNIETGESALSKTKYSIKKAIVMPLNFNREIERMFGKLEVDIEDRIVIIKKADIPITIGNDDYVITHEVVHRVPQPGKRFNIEKFQKLDDNISIMFYGRFMKGGERGEIIDQRIRERLIIEEVLSSSADDQNVFPLPLPLIF